MNLLIRALKRNLAAGLLVTLPALGTVWLLIFLWTSINRPLYGFLLRFSLSPEELTNSWQDALVRWCLAHQLDLSSLSQIPGLGAALVFTTIFAAGMVARSLLGRTIINLGESIVHRLPLVGTIYASLKQVMEAMFAENAGAAREAVLVEFPRAGAWSVGFITGPAGAVGDGETDTRVFCFIPAAPFPTTGFLILVERSATRPLGLPVDDAVKLIISGGIVCPGRRPG